MFQPNRILTALVLACAVTTAQARALAPMPATMPVILSAPMPAPTPPSIPSVRNVTSLGTTKPSGAVLDARGGTTPRLATESRRLDRLIRTAVCIGC